MAEKWARASAVRWVKKLDSRKASALAVPWGEGWAPIEGARKEKELGSSLAVMLVFVMADKSDVVWVRALVVRLGNWWAQLREEARAREWVAPRAALWDSTRAKEAAWALVSAVPWARQLVASSVHVWARG